MRFLPLLCLAALAAAAEDPVDRFISEQLERYRVVLSQSDTKVMLGDVEITDGALKKDLDGSTQSKIDLYAAMQRAPAELKRRFVLFMRHNELAGLACQRWQVQRAGGDVAALDAQIAMVRKKVAEVEALVGPTEGTPAPAPAD